MCTFQANPGRTYPLVSSQDTSTSHVDAAETLLSALAVLIIYELLV